MRDTKLDQAIRELIFKVYGECYVGFLKVKHMLPIGYLVTIGLNRVERPIDIMAQLEWDDFLKFLEKELRERHLHTDKFYTGFKIDPYIPPICHDKRRPDREDQRCH